MTYRNAYKHDLNKITEYCAKHKLKVPDNSVTIFIAEHEGEIKGLVALKRVYQIEPLIADNSLVANRLYGMIDGVIKANGIKEVRAVTSRDNGDFIKVLDKEDFVVINFNKLTLERSEDG